MAQQERELKLEELKDKYGDHHLRISSPWNGNIMYRTTEGYKNKSDMIDTSVATSIRILKEYAPEKLNQNEIKK